MTPALSILLLGFLLGVRHAIDPDHVVAVTTIVARERRLWASSLIGAFWGIGHTATIFVVGGAIVLFGIVIPPRVGLGMELTVALMLVALGVANLSGLVARTRRARNARDAAAPAVDPAPAASRWQQAARPMVVGIVHGLAGSAAVALLVLATIHDARWSVLYLGVFGVGTIAGMMALTTAFALPVAFTSRRFDRASLWLTGATGLASVALGTLLSYELFFVHGLLSSAPVWSPQ
jgi:high-affinity nickel-transport protein